MLERMGGIQDQYAPSGYVGLWSRIEAFPRESLTRALEDGSAVQGTLMRSTIHLVARRDYWPFALGVRRARREWAARVSTLPDEPELRAQAARLRELLSDGPRTQADLGDAGKGFIGNLGLWVELVRVPPSGTWERRRADRLALADAWVGPEAGTEEEGRTHLVRAYLRGFGPAPWKDIASWAGVPVPWMRAAGANLDLVRYADADGRELVDLAGRAIPDPDVPAPVRFVAHWDNLLLAHAKRTGALTDEHRGKVFAVNKPFSVGAVLVDGRTVGEWRMQDGRVAVELYEPVSATIHDEIQAERAALEAFIA